MRHRKAGVKLGRTSSHRKAMFRNMVTSLFKYEKIRTTDVKAKELRSWADHLVTLAKRGDLHARRQALSIIREKSVVHKLFAEAKEKFGSRQGGYTRIIKLGKRPGDAAPISVVELITMQSKSKKPKESKKEISVKPDLKEETKPVESEKDTDDRDVEVKDSDLIQKEEDSEPVKDESKDSEKDEDAIKDEESSENNADKSEDEAEEKKEADS